MKLHVLTAVFLLLCALLQSVATWPFPQDVALDEENKYHLSWRLEDEDGKKIITFKVEVKTFGYVGFGISPNCLMPQSDIVTGWIKDGKPYFQDRHAVGRKMPIIDEQQDWFLTYANENDTHTILVFRRELDTCDEDDYIIDDSTMRIIYAWSDTKPTGDHINYHFENRGYKSLLLLEEKFFAPDDANLLQWDLMSENFDITPYEMFYLCKLFKSPPLYKKHQIVLARPIIQKGHEHFIHHMTVAECDCGTDEEYEQYLNHKGYDCFGQFTELPEPIARCKGVKFGWAVGGEDMVFPEHAGMPLPAGEGKYYMLQVHYDNPQRIPGIIDTSGMRLFYTPHLRKYDAGSINFGVPVSPRVFVPPFQEEYTVAGHSNSECLAHAIPKDGIKIFGILLHSHLLAKSMVARHFRGKKELQPIAADKKYDFHYQEYRYFQDEITFLPHDQITIECCYNSSKRQRVTFGGGGTREEMCLGHVVYYPLICGQYQAQSVPTFDEINSVLKTDFSDDSHLYQLFSHNWTDCNITKLHERMRYSKHNSVCYFGTGNCTHEDTQNSTSLISYPEDYEPYVPETSKCNEKLIAKHGRDTPEDYYYPEEIWPRRHPRRMHPRHRNPYLNRSPYQDRSPYLDRSPYQERSPYLDRSPYMDRSPYPDRSPYRNPYLRRHPYFDRED